jgi:hypothetical protein
MAEVARKCSCGGEIAWWNDRRVRIGGNEPVPCVVVRHTDRETGDRATTTFWGYASVNDDSVRRKVDAFADQIHEREVEVVETAPTIPIPRLEPLRALAGNGTLSEMLDREERDRPARSLLPLTRAARIQGEWRPEGIPADAEQCACGAWVWWRWLADVKLVSLTHWRDPSRIERRNFDALAVPDPALIGRRMREWLIELHADDAVRVRTPETETRGGNDVSVAGPVTPETRGKNICVTGKIGTLTRDEVHAWIKKLGGYPELNVGRFTHYLVVGDRPGRIKVREAQRLNVPQKPGAWLINLIQGADKAEKQARWAEEQAALQRIRDEDAARVRERAQRDLDRQAERNRAIVGREREAKAPPPGIPVMVDSQGRIVPVPEGAEYGRQPYGITMVTIDGKVVGAINDYVREARIPPPDQTPVADLPPVAKLALFERPSQIPTPKPGDRTLVGIDAGGRVWIAQGGKRIGRMAALVDEAIQPATKAAADRARREAASARYEYLSALSRDADNPMTPEEVRRLEKVALTIARATADQPQPERRERREGRGRDW